MPTVAELQIILQAQDNASAQLRRLSGDVQRLNQQVEGVQRTTARGGGFLGGLNIGAGVAAAQGAFQALGGVIAFVGESVVGLNSRLERTTATFEAMTGSADAARDLLRITREEAARGFDLSQMEQAARTLVNFAQGSRQQFRELLQLAEQLAVIDPAAGIESAAFAIREALSGDFTSLAERFEVSRVAIQRWREQGLSNLEIVQRAIESVGGSREAVDRLGQTFEARLTTLQNFGNELRRLFGAGLFDQLSQLLGRAVGLLEEYGDRLQVFASAVGAAVAGIAERLAAAASGPLRALFELFAPGLWDDLAAGMARVPEAVERTAQAAERAVPVVRDLTRDLARAGVEAATLQLQADRVRRSYDEQLEPLERQLRLLQQSADVQRLQNALATNRATVEGIRLEREITALQRAARGQEDPNAPGLTLRQRMIALALQERRLQQEQLGLEEERRPLVQSLQGQIAAIQEQQRQALAPLEAQLSLQRDRIAQLQLERQEQELATQEAVAGVQRVRDAWTAAGSPEALADAKKRGEELADEWLKGWEEWVDRNGGNIMTALWNSFKKWYDSTGKGYFEQLGTDVGTALGSAAADAAASTFGTRIQEHLAALRQNPLLAGFLGGVLGPAGPGIAALPQVASLPASIGQQGIVNEIGPITVTLGGVNDPGFGERLKAALTQFLAGFILSEAVTDPGASGRQQGAGRTP